MKPNIAELAVRLSSHLPVRYGVEPEVLRVFLYSMSSLIGLRRDPKHPSWLKLADRAPRSSLQLRRRNQSVLRFDGYLKTPSVDEGGEAASGGWRFREGDCFG